MVFIQFYVICQDCGHKNRPSKNVEEGVRAVLLGTFTACSKCKKEFRQITVPAGRPLVKQVAGEIGANALHSRIMFSESQSQWALGH